MTFEEYVRHKLSLKLNLLYSKGVKQQGVISETLISKLASKVYDFGTYRLITKMSFPVDLVISDKMCGYITIDFTPVEFRNKKLVSILK